MKSTALFLIFLSTSIVLYGQVPQNDDYCAVPNLDSATAVALPFYNNNQYLENHLIQNGYDDLPNISFPAGPNARPGSFIAPNYLIPLNLHIYRNNANDPSSAVSQVNAENYVCEVNQIYRDAGTAIQFYTNRVEIDGNDTYNSQIGGELDTYVMWANQRLQADPSKGINVFFIRYTDNWNKSGFATLPYYPTPPNADYSLFVRTHENPSGSPRDFDEIVGSLAHELGHTLGLLHTHHPGRLPALIFNEQNGTINNGCYQESVHL